MKLLKLCVAFLSLLTPIYGFNTSASTACTTKINNFQGSCIKPTDCSGGGIYNNLCPSVFKCCVNDVNSAPWLFWRYVSKDEFRGLFPSLSSIRTDTLFPWFNKAIDSLLEDNMGKDQCHIIAAFSAQVGHESLDLSTFEEFASGEAYEGRCKQLGNCNPGDGVRFKGRGAIQVTGRSNYQKASVFIGEDFIQKPDLLVLPSYGFQASVWFWVSNKLNQFCTGNSNDFLTLTKRINGGTNGIEDRISRWNRALNVLEC